MDQFGIDQIKACGKIRKHSGFPGGKWDGADDPCPTEDPGRIWEQGGNEGCRGCLKRGPFPEHFAAQRGGTAQAQSGDESPGREGALWGWQWLWRCWEEDFGGLSAFCPHQGDNIDGAGEMSQLGYRESPR